MNKRHPQKFRQEVIAKYEGGARRVDLMREYKLSKPTLHSWIKKYSQNSNLPILLRIQARRKQTLAQIAKLNNDLTKPEKAERALR